MPTRLQMTESILAKWRSAGNTFVRFLDNDAGNMAATNLAWVSLRDVMAHIDGAHAWKADWDGNITEARPFTVPSAMWSQRRLAVVVGAGTRVWHAHGQPSVLFVHLHGDLSTIDLPDLPHRDALSFL